MCTGGGNVKVKLSTVMIIVGVFIIFLYALIEVSYYASKITIENKYTATLEIPAINLKEEINNKSLSYGVYYDPRSSIPGSGTTVLFGHRTLYGSPFMNLDKLKKGDVVYVNWPKVGKIEYKVDKSFVVPADYEIPLRQGNKLLLVTCYPFGSTSKRLIVECKIVKILPLEKIKVENPNKNYSLAIIVLFFLFCMLIYKIYPYREDKLILLVVFLSLTLILIFAYINPVPPEFISDKLLSWS
ncbi:sortase family protein [Methanothermus fervidus DSM 2088]|uniref:Sortase family protein n=1 Tax=Methanothermus fervidus (strain ATCC 43054 / DSM 2088 / JCM 10308 / V24 S) TaxID=523846 RepID=E3GW98_METFV|nr:sortase family protein [Methanothermus fervidus DSM 2088]